MSRKDIPALIVFAVLIIATVLLVNGISNKQTDSEYEIVRDAVKNAALTCYAVEGAYPDDIEYLREYYGLAYDEERYSVFYTTFASNQLPDIRVNAREAKQ